MKIKIIILLISMYFLILACSISLYMPENTNNETQKQLLYGRKMYVEHCSSCHNLFFPKQFSKEQWTKAIDEMQLKANISNDEKNSILLYLISEP